MVSSGLSNVKFVVDATNMPELMAWADVAVPSVLMSGNHAQIKRWRREQSLLLTFTQRPDVLALARRDGKLSPSDETFLRGLHADSPAGDKLL